MEKRAMKHKKSILEALLGGLFGLSFFSAISYPKSIINKKLPEKKIKNLCFTPSVQYQTRGKLYHFHHWLIFSSLYITLAALKRSTLKNKVFHGFILGSILQGLLYADRFKMIHKLDEIAEKKESAKPVAN